MGVDAEHVRHVPALFPHAREDFADVVRDLRFVELREASHRPIVTERRPYSSSVFFPLVMTSGSTGAATTSSTAGVSTISARACVTPTTARSGSSYTLTPSG